MTYSLRVSFAQDIPKNNKIVISPLGATKVEGRVF
jgi:hypothetical protein